MAKFLARLAQGSALCVIGAYRITLSPLLAGSCRFQPSCSEYTQAAVRQLGVCRGLALGFKRLLRCHPWGGSGWDPVR